MAEYVERTVPDHSSWTSDRKVMRLDATKPHTLTDFVDDSMHEAIGIRECDLPPGMGPDTVARRFREVGATISLRPRPFGYGYFHGWFGECGIPVRTDDGTELFKIVPTLSLFELRFQPAAAALLKDFQST